MTSKITIIDWSKTIDDIANVNELPAEAQLILRNSTRMQSCGFNELTGSGPTCGFSASGYFHGKRFVIESMGWKTSWAWRAWSPQKGIYDVVPLVSP